jgi:hypothetical protein
LMIPKISAILPPLEFESPSESKVSPRSGLFGWGELLSEAVST